jgi:hypothetical protein
VLFKARLAALKAGFEGLRVNHMKLARVG